jgi:hypothetical protein
LILVAACSPFGSPDDNSDAGGRSGPGAPATPTPVPRVEPGSKSDPDGDGVPENFDNCPGIDNPDQADLDFVVVVDTDIYEEGDECDDDIDGDGVENRDDDFPRDTDDDGVDNEEDEDDDGDGIEDDDDLCPLTENPEQKDTDGDGGGDLCGDGDADDDDIPDYGEAIAGSDPIDAGSLPEFLGHENTCADGTDNDGDGNLDQDDDGCTDTDRDARPDYLDNCPNGENPDQLDWDEDGDGNECDTDDDGDGVADIDDVCSEPEVQKADEVDGQGCLLE